MLMVVFTFMHLMLRHQFTLDPITRHRFTILLIAVTHLPMDGIMVDILLMGGIMVSIEAAIQLMDGIMVAVIRFMVGIMAVAGKAESLMVAKTLNSRCLEAWADRLGIGTDDLSTIIKTITKL